MALPGNVKVEVTLFVSLTYDVVVGPGTVTDNVVDDTLFEAVMYKVLVEAGAVMREVVVEVALLVMLTNEVLGVQRAETVLNAVETAVLLFVT